ncbi:magnesium/cobalt transporter CorA [Aegicerativicinus sediminis]|uniref:magnesium/cobalt transporter CorA n=1 Tax=Aegicerativicinus sediminis TaxID=2893202 RepID=UPI001E5E1EE4|nr:magnesium/cobalt transporter CorA [Aegicerativicinus sediminis]
MKKAKLPNLKIFHRRHKKYEVSNLPPGTIRYRGKKESTKTHFDIIEYNENYYNHHVGNSVEDSFGGDSEGTVTWINLNGLNNIQAIEELGEHYGIHPLTLEDIANTNQRPKLEENEGYIFMVVKMLYYNDEHELIIEHLSIILSHDYVITFQESDGDVFDNLRDRIEHKKGRIRGYGASYLAYALLDAVVDNYFSVMEVLGEHIEDMESNIFEMDTTDEVANEIQMLKRQILKIRRAVLPLREGINRLEKNEHPLMDPKIQHFIRDLYDHIIQVSESIDLYREMVWGLMDMHMSIISNKMNEIMKVLTIIATIFIPLTFIAGIYGMNFENMPELQTRYGYFVLLSVMAVIFIIMLLYFRRKKWL